MTSIAVASPGFDALVPAVLLGLVPVLVMSCAVIFRWIDGEPAPLEEPPPDE